MQENNSENSRQVKYKHKHADFYVKKRGLFRKADQVV